MSKNTNNVKTLCDCGAEISPEMTVCPECGIAVNGTTTDDVIEQKMAEVKQAAGELKEQAKQAADVAVKATVDAGKKVGEVATNAAARVSEVCTSPSNRTIAKNLGIITGGLAAIGLLWGGEKVMRGTSAASQFIAEKTGICADTLQETRENISSAVDRARVENGEIAAAPAVVEEEVVPEAPVATTGKPRARKSATTTAQTTN